MLPNPRRWPIFTPSLHKPLSGEGSERPQYLLTVNTFSPPTCPPQGDRQVPCAALTTMEMNAVSHMFHDCFKRRCTRVLSKMKARGLGTSLGCTEGLHPGCMQPGILTPITVAHRLSPSLHLTIPSSLRPRLRLLLPVCAQSIHIERPWAEDAKQTRSN